jgi:hypothetical protein
LGQPKNTVVKNMFITTFAQNYSQNAGNAIQRHKNFKNREGATACPQTHKEMPSFRLK